MAPRNQFPARSPLGSAQDFFAITPSDSADLADVPRGVWVGGAGNLVVTGLSGDVTFQGIPAGTMLPIAPTRVKATGTTATALLGVL